MLKIFRPDENPETSDTPTSIETGSPDSVESGRNSGQPIIYSFADWVDRLRSGPRSLVDRARSIHANVCCPQCRHASVLPLMLNDGRTDAAGQVVPGTASLVGFHCEDCDHEWPATRSNTAKIRV
jgi:hypothetical protein